MALITCRDVSLSYDGRTVLSGLGFEVNAGDYLCIVGENGSGKSTLVRALLSLKGADSGEIRLGDGLRQKEIGYLPQQTDAQKDFPASIWEGVVSGRLNKRGLRPFYSPADRAAARENMEKLGLGDLTRRSFRELSGGQQQRVLLARALCATNKLLLLDEPAAGLDPVVTGEFYRLIQELNKSGITIIMVSHDIRSAVKYASHILHLLGRPLYFGDTAGYLRSAVGARFLGGETDA
jgi:zinc transport system ATP-binding protein